jgi:hypothetical protein
MKITYVAMKMIPTARTPVQRRIAALRWRTSMNRLLP